MIIGDERKPKYYDEKTGQTYPHRTPTDYEKAGPSFTYKDDSYKWTQEYQPALAKHYGYTVKPLGPAPEDPRYMMYEIKKPNTPEPFIKESEMLYQIKKNMQKGITSPPSGIYPRSQDIDQAVDIVRKKQVADGVEKAVNVENKMKQGQQVTIEEVTDLAKTNEKMPDGFLVKVPYDQYRSSKKSNNKLLLGILGVGALIGLAYVFSDEEEKTYTSSTFYY